MMRKSNGGEMLVVDQNQENPWERQMDEQTRLARFESMRKGGPNGGRRVSRNKKLYVIHADLQKQCDKAIKRFEFDARISTAEINRQKLSIKAKLEKLGKQKQKCELQREKTHSVLAQFSAGHVQRERTFMLKMAADERRSRHTQDSELVKSLSKMSMPSRMKKRLTCAHYGITYDSDDDNNYSY